MKLRNRLALVAVLASTASSSQAFDMRSCNQPPIPGTWTLTERMNSLEYKRLDKERSAARTACVSEGMKNEHKAWLETPGDELYKRRVAAMDACSDLYPREAIEELRLKSIRDKSPMREANAMAKDGDAKVAACRKEAQKLPLY